MNLSMILAVYLANCVIKGPYQWQYKFCPYHLAGGIAISDSFYDNSEGL